MQVRFSAPRLMLEAGNQSRRYLRSDKSSNELGTGSFQGDPRVAQFYEKELVDKELWPLGEDLRGRFEKTKKLLLQVQDHQDLLGGPQSQLLRQKLALRGPYVTPLNVLQVGLHCQI